jgi:SlyX protein
MDERLDRIEIRMAYLEQANTQLSDTVYRQQQEIDTLRVRLAALVGRLDTAQAHPTVYAPEDEKPPHY